MSLQSSMSVNSFWESINILITKFNVINKRLWGCKVVFSCICKAKMQMEWHKPPTCTRLDETENIDTFVKLFFKEFDLIPNSDSTNDHNIEIKVIELLPKLYSLKKAFQLIVIEKYNTEITFYDITPESYKQNLCPDFKYSISLQDNKVFLGHDPEFTEKSFQWLVDKVLPQFVKWGEENTTNKNKFCNNSLSLISTEKYYKKYNDLKSKYGKEMVEVWPEGTDPSKYVYEDVAIATYLLLFWEDECKQTQTKTFVDLGCGNGLLVYILTKEGHKGIGIDVRKRQIWDMYPDDVKLEVKTIIPSDSNLFPEADWLIGNHSDELTPWIPVIAARSSYKCRFFLLPCCAYNFDGSKYQRKDSSKSQYTEYLEYIRQICQTCGFDTAVDRLKIPSTKRICLVGKRRIHSEENYQQYCDDINLIISKDRISCNTELSNTTSWASDFKARDSVEKVRNCTQMDKSIIEAIVCNITKNLLEGCNLETQWSPGKLVDISELISLLTDDQLQAMKAECGGLQTLLRNNHHIFKVQSGKVQLRYPKTIEEVNQNEAKKKKKTSTVVKVKQKPCWFHINHPQGCPLTDSNCSYLHGS